MSSITGNISCGDKMTGGSRSMASPQRYQNWNLYLSYMDFLMYYWFEWNLTSTLSVSHCKLRLPSYMFSNISMVQFRMGNSLKIGHWTAWLMRALCKYLTLHGQSDVSVPQLWPSLTNEIHQLCSISQPSQWPCFLWWSDLSALASISLLVVTLVRWTM